MELSDLHKLDRVCVLTYILKMETLVHEREARTHRQTRMETAVREAITTHTFLVGCEPPREEAAP